MCGPPHKAKDVSPARQNRLRLWEVPSDLHCAILGTCLSFSELVKTGRKAGIAPRSNATDYDIHAWFVNETCEQSQLSRLIHRRLDRMHRRAIDSARTARSEAELTRFWSLSLKKDDIPGPFWALMTHPNTTPSLRARAFGEVHMISHLMGVANRDASQRLQAAETERDRLRDQLGAAKRLLAKRAAELRSQTDLHAVETGTLRKKLLTAEAEVADLTAAATRLDEFEHGDVFRKLHQENAALAKNLAEAERTCVAQAQKCGALEQELVRARKDREEAIGRCMESESRCAALEAMALSVLDDEVQPRSPAFDLCGRRIAYVGGRQGSVHRFRALIEQSNGKFFHHDGGVEDNVARLDRVLHHADMVLCPVDCVSHGACLKAKKFCKRADKTFVPLKNASLASLIAALYEAIGCSPDNESGTVIGANRGEPVCVPQTPSGDG